LFVEAEQMIDIALVIAAGGTAIVEIVRRF
jgi:hypothetical protein